MADKVEQISGQHFPSPVVSVEEVNRILEVGRLLFAVLTPEEHEELQELLETLSFEPILQEPPSMNEIGNTNVT